VLHSAGNTLILMHQEQPHPSASAEGHANAVLCGIVVLSMVLHRAVASQAGGWWRTGWCTYSIQHDHFNRRRQRLPGRRLWQLLAAAARPPWQSWVLQRGQHSSADGCICAQHLKVW